MGREREGKAGGREWEWGGGDEKGQEEDGRRGAEENGGVGDGYRGQDERRRLTTNTAGSEGGAEKPVVGVEIASRSIIIRLID